MINNLADRVGETDDSVVRLRDADADPYPVGRVGTHDDPELLRATYDYFAPRFSFPPRINMAGIKDTLEFYAETSPGLKGRNPEDFVDHSLLDEMEKEGFFKALGS